MERIEPGKPQQNGRHERMHRTLKAETTQPAARTLRLQQTLFDRFLQEYNHQRPHEALAFAVPSQLYRVSLRPYPHRLEEIQYPASMEVRLVSKNGDIRIDYAGLFITHALAGERVGLEPVSDGRWRVWFAALCLGEVDQRKDWRGSAFRRTRWLKLQSPSGLLSPEPTSILEQDRQH